MMFCLAPLFWKIKKINRKGQGPKPNSNCWFPQRNNCKPGLQGDHAWLAVVQVEMGKMCSLSNASALIPLYSETCVR